MNPYYRELTIASPLTRLWDWRLYLSDDNVAESRPFLDLLNVRYYVDLKSDQTALGAVLTLDRPGDLDVYESPTAWPRAFFTNRISFYTQPEQFLQQVLQGDGKPFASALPDETRASPTLAALPDDQPSRTVVPATHYQLTEDATGFDIDAPEPGLVVLTETYWQGYARAEVDGHSVPVVRINHAFEGVAVDSPGIHRVFFRYRPRHFAPPAGDQHRRRGLGRREPGAGAETEPPPDGARPADRSLIPMSLAAPRHRLSVVVPIFNERATAKEALDAIVAKEMVGLDLRDHPGGKQFHGRHPRHRAQLPESSPRPDHPGGSSALRQGKGHAVRAGLARATGDIVLIQDADLEYDLADYETLLAPIVSGRQAFVLGARHGEGGWAIRKFAGQPVRAFILNVAHWSFALVINLSLGIWLRDPFTMYKVFRRDCITGLTFESNRFDFDWELLIKLVRKGYRPIEIPITYRSRSFEEGKKVRLFHDPLTWIVAWAKSRFGPL